MDSQQTKAMEKTLSRLLKKDGYVTPSGLVEVSRPKTAVTHDCFEWDDQKAGEEYRLIQARHWIRVIKVEVEDKDQGRIKVSLAHVPKDTGKGEGEYKPINIIVDSPSDFERALNAAIKDLEAAQHRVAELKNAVSDLGDKDKAAVLAALATTLSTAREILQKMQ